MTSVDSLQVLHFITKTLKTDNVSQKSQSFKPYTKAETDFVKIK